MTRPAASIVVTSHNYSRYLERCLTSCVKQTTREPFEVLIVDDGSTDDSREIARRFVGSTVHLLERPNGGIEKASNAGIAAAAAELIVRVDADDYLLPAHLETMLSRMPSAGSAFLYSDYLVVDEHDNVTSEEQLPAFDEAEIKTRGDFLATGTLYRREAIRQVGGYEEGIVNSGLENYELILKMLRAGHRGLHVAQPLFAYRRHGLNVSAQRRDAIVRYGRALFESLSLGPYTTNAFHPYKLVLDHE